MREEENRTSAKLKQKTKADDRGRDIQTEDKSKEKEGELPGSPLYQMVRLQFVENRRLCLGFHV